MEAEINCGGNGASYEFDISVDSSLFRGNQSTHETTPYFLCNEDNQVETLFGNENGGIMPNNPSEVTDDPNMLQLDLVPPSLDTPAPAFQFEFPLLSNPATEVEMEKQNSPQLEPFPPVELYGFQPDPFPPQTMGPLDPKPTFGGNGHVQLVEMFPQPQMNQQQPPNQQWLSLNPNAPGLPEFHPPQHLVAGTQHYRNFNPNSILPWYQQPFNPHHHQPFHKRMSISEFLAAPFDLRQLEQERSYQLHLLNSGPHIYQDTRGTNENIRFSVPLQLDTVPIKTNRKGKETKRARKTVEHGESSSQKRKRGQTTTQESNQSQSDQNSQNNEGNSNAFALSHLRPAYKTAIYDPMFETIGLPVDPHLRMFSLF